MSSPPCLDARGAPKKAWKTLVRGGAAALLPPPPSTLIAKFPQCANLAGFDAEPEPFLTLISPLCRARFPQKSEHGTAMGQSLGKGDFSPGLTVFVEEVGFSCDPVQFWNPRP